MAPSIAVSSLGCYLKELKFDFPKALLQGSLPEDTILSREPYVAHCNANLDKPVQGQQSYNVDADRARQN